ncbi:hypothetical protein GQ600_19602 [Phytophthora cactorum]|nr:hypothetical protein GQ600_19602 [Phytophthora cactorum]
MRSKPGGREQESHKDYPAEVIAAAKTKKNVPASMIFALYEGTRLRVYDECTDTKDESKARILTIPVENHRIHCYLTYRDLVWEPDFASNVLPTHFICQHCGRKEEYSNEIRQHRRYCSKNPDAAKNTVTS